jgi:hypothetical protein
MRACKIFWTFLLIIATKICFAQNKIYAGIQENKKTYPKKNFFFEKVIDARKNRENIGFAYKVDLASEHPVDFKRGLTLEILSFLKRTFLHKLSTNKILVQVNHFEIGHFFRVKKMIPAL